MARATGAAVAVVLLLVLLSHPAQARILDAISVSFASFWPFNAFSTPRDSLSTSATSSPSDFVPVGADNPITTSAASAPGPSPGPPGPPVGPTCPPSAGQCDFYFKDYDGVIPTFSIAGTKGDEVISTAIEASVKGSTVDVETVNTEAAEYICGASPELPPDNQFYTAKNFVQVRTFQPQDPASNYDGQYVRLNLTSVEMMVYGAIFNFNKGQESTLFREVRRCLIFKVKA